MKPRKFKDNWKGAGAFTALAEWLNGVARCLNNLRGLDGVQITPNKDGGLDFMGSDHGAGAAGTYSTFELTGLADGVASFAGGYVVHGTRAIAVGSSTVTVSGGTESDPVFVAIEFTPGGDGSAKFVGPLSAHPTNTPTVLYRVLAAFYSDGGTPTLLRIHHIGDIDFTAVLPP